VWTRTGTVLTVSSRAMVAACDRLDVDTEALLRAVGISRQTLDDPDARLDAAQVSALWSKAYELSRDPVLSLHAAEACPIGAYKVIDYMAANAATVGEAFSYSARYFWLINTAIRLPIDESGDPVTFAVVDESGPAGVSRPYAEYCLAAFALHVRAATGVSFPLRRVTFVHRAPRTSASTSASSAARCSSRPSTTASTSMVRSGGPAPPAPIQACSRCWPSTPTCSSRSFRAPPTWWNAPGAPSASACAAATRLSRAWRAGWP
jgi:hypothetical protein